MFVYVPRSDHSSSWQARYVINWFGNMSQQIALVDQEGLADQWVSLGIYTMSNQDSVYTTDATRETTAGRQVAVDAVKFVRRGTTYLPNIQFSDTWVSSVIICNNGGWGELSVRFYDGSGSKVGGFMGYLSPHQSVTIETWDNRAVSGTVDAGSDMAVVVENQNSNQTERTNYNGILPGGSSGSPGWEQAGVNLYAPIIKNGYGGRSSLVLITNAGSASTTATIKFYNASGIQVETQQAALSTNGSALVFPSAGYCATSPCSARIASNAQPLAAVILEYTSTTNNRATYNAFSAGATSNYVPVVKKNYAGHTTGVSVQNLGAQATAVQLTCYNTSGGTYTCGTQTVQPMATAVFWMGTAANLPDGFFGSAVVNASQPSQVATLIQESGSPYKLATNALLAGSTTAYAPEIYGNYTPGGSSSTWNSGIGIQNVGSADANVTVTYYDSGGNQVGSPVSSPAICPNCAWAVNYWAGNMPSNFYGSAKITSNQPIAAVVNAANTGSGDTKDMYTVSNR